MSDHTPLPIVAIVGRPNVGKSRLFNRYAGHRRALVEDLPGVTRDRIAEEVSLLGRRFLLVDTAGLDPADGAGLEAAVQSQARAAVEQADAILFVVDGQSGLLPEDAEIARTLRRTDKPVALAVNKIDLPEHRERASEFYSLGFDMLFPISAEHGGGAFDVLETLVEALHDAPSDLEPGSDTRAFSPLTDGKHETPDYSEEPLDGDFGEGDDGDGDEDELEETSGTTEADDSAQEIRVAVVGRPNVGKSSLVNRLLGEERVVVSEVAGTTRDAIDTRIEVGEQSFVFVDTAGLRRPGRRAQNVERVSALMTVRALERAHVALVLVDASEGIGDQDAHIASLVRARGCAALVLANKWDRVESGDGKPILEDIAHGLRFMTDVPVMSISALTGARVGRLFPAIQRVAAEGRRRIPTSELNRWLQETVRRHEPALGRKSGHVRRPIKFFYASQIGTRPPTFLLFCTRPKSVQTAYRRYLENRLRERFGFDGTAIRLRFRSRGG
ncbi:MAG: ribosome biogenesis GTPase Der [Deltaproteobacteria bacterium]|nr:ribosome biogenesis GTPase Der [Deltaproteobacteria bacterium]